ncbi:MAG: acetyltransferase [Frankiales bacterium]|nr:acetyltransferase [Frankiales bacterium]
MLLRREVPADEPAVESVVARAFATGDGAEPVEVGLLRALRAGPDWLPRLSWVAVDAQDRVVGHAVCSVAHVGSAPVVALGPVAVRPRLQGRGTGTALVHALLGAADVLGAPLVALLGEPAFYGRFGFVAGTSLGVLPPEPSWGPYFQVRTLTAYAPRVRGPFQYAPPFRDL